MSAARMSLYTIVPAIYQLRLEAEGAFLEQLIFVAVHEQIRHNVQNILCLQRHISATTMGSELILGMAVREG